jgi:hypothetical protein
MPEHTPSPYELCAPPGNVERLHPRLQAYFSRIPDGHVGRGAGVFDVVGTPRRWLWPVLALFALDGVMFPAWERDVPFAVENRPVLDTDGNVAVRAERTFRFRPGSRVMTDAITAEPTPSTSIGARTRTSPHTLVDHLGRHGRVRATLRIEVAAGALRLVSTHVSFLVRGRELRLPSAVAPRVTLVERFDDEAARQRVSLTLTAPLIGTIYRYEGAFTYEIVPDQRKGEQ